MTTTMSNAVKETKAQRVERLKRAKNPWEGLDEIRRFAREGFESIPPEWIGTYFRWWGVYTQGDGSRRHRRPKRRGPRPPAFYGADQDSERTAEVLISCGPSPTLLVRYANGIGDITVRQNIQLHWVTIEALPEPARRRCAKVGLNSQRAPAVMSHET